MIYADRVRLRAMEREDIPRCVAWLNDPEVRHGLAMYLPMSIAQEEQWFEGMLQRPADQQSLMIDVREGDGWRHVGGCGYHEIQWRHRAGEVGIFIGEKSLWNQGYGTEAMRLLLRHGFETLNLHRVMLRVYDYNARAARSYEKAGFVREGALRQAIFHEGRYHDCHLMSVLRAEWDARTAGGGDS